MSPLSASEVAAAKFKAGLITNNRGNTTMKTTGLIITLIILLFCMLLILAAYQYRHVPYERPAARTIEEQKAVDRATKKIGRHTIIDGPELIIIRMDNGKRRIIRRG